MGTYSALARQYNVHSPDIVTVNLRSSSAQIGRAMGNFGLRELPSARNAIELMLYGSEGTSLAQYHDMHFLYTQADGTEVKEDMIYHQRGYYFNNEVHGMHYGEFANYAEYFASALLENTQYSPNLNDGLAIFAVMEAARRSMAAGQPVKVATVIAEITAA
jgi:predicted dehydrogenase